MSAVVDAASPLSPGGTGEPRRSPDGSLPELSALRSFLFNVRRRRLLICGLRAAGWTTAAVLVALVVMAIGASSVGPAGFWLPLTAALVTGSFLLASVIGIVLPALALRDDRAMARAVGVRRPELASDLLSAVELGPCVDEIGRQDAVSGSLVRALVRSVSGHIGRLDTRRLEVFMPATRAGVAAAAAAVILAGSSLLAPQSVGRGLGLLLRRPTRFEGAAVSAEPIVGDVRVSYQYPAYTHLPPRTVEGSTGDIVAVKGTKVRLETRALRSAREASLLLGETGGSEIPASVIGDKVVAELTLDESTTYRFWLSPLVGRPVREARGHRLEAEPDRPPRVEIFGPADRLELPSPRPVEVGFAADDDFGVDTVDLVHRVGDGPERRERLRDGGGERVTQGRMVWDPPLSDIRSGDRIAYRVEARDFDGISGPKTGTSRTLYIVVQNPREGSEERFDRQREILDKLVGDLADRLEAADARSDSDDAPARLARFQALNETEEAHVALLGRLLDDERRDGGMAKTLRAALAGVADRLGRLLREESSLISALGVRAIHGPTAPAALRKLEQASTRHIVQLEKEALLLDDLLGRQRLEELASMGRELTEVFQRLQDLLARYQATKDEALKRQLEREIRDLRARISDLATRIAELRGRNDVPEEWQNMPDLKEAEDRARDLDRLLEKGDTRSLASAMDELGRTLKRLRSSLDQTLSDFGEERFSEESRTMSELVKKLGDLEGDERDLLRDTEPIAERQRSETERRLKDQLEGFLQEELRKVENLRQKVAGLKGESIDPAVQDELERARESAKQLRRLLSERDLGEARNEAERAEAALGRAGHEVAESAEARRPWSPGARNESEAVARAIGEAGALAAEIASDLEGKVPRPGEMLQPGDREAARSQGERQSAIGERTEELAQEAAKGAGRVPRLEQAVGELKAAAERMRQAAEQLRRGEAREGAAAEREAAERLAKLRDTLEQGRLGMARNAREPVRIPGADESKAPREWRQELLEAMKERAPERFRDEVRRYYEELVR